MKRYAIEHTTTVDYGSVVSFSQQLARLCPLSVAEQKLLSFGVTIHPAPSGQREWVDYFQNRIHYFHLLEKHERLVVTTESEVEISPRSIWSGEATCGEYAGKLAAMPLAEKLGCEEFRHASPLVPETGPWEAVARRIFAPKAKLSTAWTEFFEWLGKDFTFDTGATTVDTPVGDFYNRKHGVCQDFALLTLSMLRSLRWPARYVSGYLLTSPPAGRERLLGVDASHAWVEWYLPGAGWQGCDPTNFCAEDERYIKLGRGRDYQDVSPLRGFVVGGSRQSVKVAVTVREPAAKGPAPSPPSQEQAQRITLR